MCTTKSASSPSPGAFRIAGEVDALIIVERDNLDEVLKKLYGIDGIEDTRSYVTIEEIK